MKQIIDALRANNSTLAKEKILLENKDNELWKKILFYTYNTNYNFYIKKMPIKLEHCDGCTWEDIFSLLDSMRNKEMRGNRGYDALYLLLENCTKDVAEIVQLILGRDIKCGINIKTINKVYDDYIPTTSYMGCQQFNAKKIKAIIERDGYAISELKSDGQYGNSIMTTSIDIVSRNGKTTWLDGKIIDALTNFQRTLPEIDMVLNGELMIKGFSRSQSNGLITRLTNINEKLSEGETKKAQKAQDEILKETGKTYLELQDDIFYVVWDLIPYDYYLKKFYHKKRIDRLKELQELVEAFDNDCIQLQRYRIVKSYKEAIEHMKEELQNGEEGTVVKSAICPWRDGKKDEQFKGKVEFQVELRIVGFNEGKKGSKNENTLGALRCESECGTIKVNVGGGLIEKRDAKTTKDFTRDEIWNDKDRFMNQVITIKCNGLSRNKKEGINFLYPNYQITRFDKDEANTLEEILKIEESILSAEEEIATVADSQDDLINSILNS